MCIKLKDNLTRRTAAAAAAAIAAAKNPKVLNGQLLGRRQIDCKVKYIVWKKHLKI